MPTDSLSPGEKRVGVPNVRPQERLFVRLAERIQGYGGHYSDSKSGDLIVYGTNIDMLVGHRTLIESETRGQQDLVARASGRTVMRVADFSFLELKAYRDGLLRDVLAIPEVVELDLNEAKNRVSVGVVSSDRTGVGESVYDVSDQLGIPRAAIEIIDLGDPDSGGNPEDFTLGGSGSAAGAAVTCSAHPTTIKECQRPMQAGVQVRADGKGNCTNAWTYPMSGTFLSSRENQSFSGIMLMATHCTAKFGEMDPVFNKVFQNSLVFTGYEYDDAPYWQCTTDPQIKCVHADASVIGIQDHTPTQNEAAYAGATSIYLVPVDPTRSIIGEVADTFVGLEVFMTGQTSGTRGADIQQTCVDRQPFGTNHGYLCQDKADYDRGDGDSGAIVFAKYNGSEREILLVGIHSNAGATIFKPGYFSPMSQVRTAYSYLPPLFHLTP